MSKDVVKKRGRPSKKPDTSIVKKLSEEIYSEFVGKYAVNFDIKKQLESFRDASSILLNARTMPLLLSRLESGEMDDRDIISLAKFFRDSAYSEEYVKNDSNQITTYGIIIKQELIDKANELDQQELYHNEEEWYV